MKTEVSWPVKHRALNTRTLKDFFSVYPYKRLKEAIDALPNGTRLHITEKFTVSLIYLNVLPLEKDAKVVKSLSIEATNFELIESRDAHDFYEQLASEIGTDHYQVTDCVKSVQIQFFNAGDIIPLVNVAIK